MLNIYKTLISAQYVLHGGVTSLQYTMQKLTNAEVLLPI